MSLDLLRQKVSIELERRQYDRDATAMYRTFRQTLGAPKITEPNAVDLIRRGEQLHSAHPYIPPSDPLGYRVAEILAKVSDVISWEDVTAVMQAITLDSHTKAQAAWIRRVGASPFPETQEQAEKRALINAVRIWQAIEVAAAGIERSPSREEDWKPTIKAVKINRLGRRLEPITPAV